MLMKVKKRNAVAVRLGSLGSKRQILNSILNVISLEKRATKHISRLSAEVHTWYLSTKRFLAVERNSSLIFVFSEACADVTGLAGGRCIPTTLVRMGGAICGFGQMERDRRFERSHKGEIE